MKLDEYGNSFCQCDFPKVRNSNSKTCENECPTGHVMNPKTRICEGLYYSHYDVQIYFETKLPVFNTAANPDLHYIDSVHADSCSPPKALGEYRGSYFSGKGHSEFIAINEMTLNNEHTVFMWVKSERGDGTLAFFKVDTFGGWKTYENEECDMTWDFAAENVHENAELDFWITSCNTVVLDLDGERVVSRNVNAGWV